LRAGDVQTAMVVACAAAPVEVAEFHVAPLYPTAESLRRGHQWFVEFAQAPADLHAFVQTLDDALRRRNIDYDEHRRNDADLPLPEIVPVSPGTFYAAMKREGRVGGQHKVPHVRNDRRFAEALLAVIGDRCRGAQP
jgi:hypothetical protein